MTPKTGAIMLKIQIYITGINKILNKLHFKYKTVHLNYNDISQYYCFYCISKQINAALASIS